jgi:hypothetical protein
MSGRKEIFHMSFSISHLPFDLVGCLGDRRDSRFSFENAKWQMENDEWKISRVLDAGGDARL